jgi:hypothetical protein
MQANLHFESHLLLSGLVLNLKSAYFADSVAIDLWLEFEEASSHSLFKSQSPLTCDTHSLGQFVPKKEICEKLTAGTATSPALEQEKEHTRGNTSKHE